MTDHHLADRIAAQIAPLIPEHGTILIGLSGGMDSVVLLHLLRHVAPRFSWKLSALHVHHGISPNADAWVDFCTELCARYAIPLHVEHVDIAPLRKHGIEAAARMLRHAAFARQSCDFIALAHHSDDQAETMLLQLLRGSGVKGAAAMPVLSPSALLRTDLSKRPVLSPSARTGLSNRSSLNIVRPLLHCSRREILDYAAIHDLRWIEDESNADESYPRNFLRHRLFPLLEQKFPSCRETLSRSARHFAEADELLGELALLDAGSAIHDDRLAVSALQALTRNRAKNLLRFFLHRAGAPMPQAARLDDMLHQLGNARSDAAVCIAFGEWEVRRYRGWAYLLHAQDDFDRNLVLPWQGEAYIAWPALPALLRFYSTIGEGISLKKLLQASVTLSMRQGGETLRPKANAARRSLRNLLQEHHVPPWRRDRLPLLYSGDELVCVAGVAIAADYLASPMEEGIRLVAEITQADREGKA